MNIRPSRQVKKWPTLLPGGEKGKPSLRGGEKKGKEGHKLQITEDGGEGVGRSLSYKATTKIFAARLKENIEPEEERRLERVVEKGGSLHPGRREVQLIPLYLKEGFIKKQKKFKRGKCRNNVLSKKEGSIWPARKKGVETESVGIEWRDKTVGGGGLQSWW